MTVLNKFEDNFLPMQSRVNLYDRHIPPERRHQTNSTFDRLILNLGYIQKLGVKPKVKGLYNISTLSTLVLNEVGDFPLGRMESTADLYVISLGESHSLGLNIDYRSRPSTKYSLNLIDQVSDCRSRFGHLYHDSDKSMRDVGIHHLKPHCHFGNHPMNTIVRSQSIEMLNSDRFGESLLTDVAIFSEQDGEFWVTCLINNKAEDIVDFLNNDG